MKTNPGRDDFVEGCSARYGVMDYMAMLASSLLPGQLSDVSNNLNRE